ncbi:MAG: flagellar hook protein FlgE [Bradymonadales bacterium]|nr:MAG: flagellar hook protein FlgE [Bradymonadales bacterium]
MSVLASLYSGISGIVSNGSALSVSGDNIANMNTTAFKSSNALFESNLTQRIGDVQIGLGSRLAATNTAFSVGSFANSTRNTDMAIEGEGFFAVQNPSGERLYTRAGAFSRNDQGLLVTTVGGFQLLGSRINEEGNIVGTPGAIDLTDFSSAPLASSSIRMNLNLDPMAALPGGVLDATSFSAAEASSNFSVPSTMYDSRGTPREVITYFRRTGDNEWQAATLTDAANLGAPVTAADGSTVVLKAWNVTFNSDGTLNTVAADNIGLVVWDDDTAGTGSPNEDAVLAGEILNGAIPWSGSDPLSFAEFSLDLGQAGGLGNATQYDLGSGSNAKFVGSNGRGVGELQSIDVTAAGRVRGIFSNGDSRDLYSIPIALFSNNEGLARIGSNLYQETASSGSALLGEAGSNGRGQVRAFALEQSNVDLASEFVKIIQYQRGFQASARTISAAADILQELVNLGR